MTADRLDEHWVVPLASAPASVPFPALPAAQKPFPHAGTVMLRAGCTARPMLTLWLLLLIALWPNRAQALCTAPLCTCTVSTTPIAFGAYNPLAYGPLDSTGTIKVTCGGVAGLLIPFTINLGKGSATTYGSRRMTSGGQTLPYNLYTDSNRTTIWGDATGGTLNVGASLLLDALGLSPGLVFTVYGRIPARQVTVPPGIYTDTISVTVTYL